MTVATNANMDATPTKPTSRRRIWALLAVLAAASAVIVVSVMAIQGSVSSSSSASNDPCDHQPCGENELCVVLAVPGTEKHACLPQEEEEDTEVEDEEDEPPRRPPVYGCGQGEITVKRADDSLICIAEDTVLDDPCSVACLNSDDTCVFHAFHLKVFCYEKSSPCASNPCGDDQYCNVFYYETAEAFPECVAIP